MIEKLLLLRSDWIRKMAIVSLLLSSIFACMAFWNNGQFCVIPKGHTQPLYFAEMSGFSADEPVLMVYVAIFSLIGVVILCFVKSKIKFLIISGFTLFFLMIPLNMFFDASGFKVVYDSIRLCHNHFLLLWCFALWYFILTVLLYLYLPKENKL